MLKLLMCDIIYVPDPIPEASKNILVPIIIGAVTLAAIIVAVMLISKSIKKNRNSNKDE